MARRYYYVVVVIFRGRNQDRYEGRTARRKTNYNLLINHSRIICRRNEGEKGFFIYQEKGNGARRQESKGRQWKGENPTYLYRTYFSSKEKANHNSTW